MLLIDLSSHLLRLDTLGALSVICILYFSLPLIINYIQLERLKKPAVGVPVLNLKGKKDYNEASQYYLYHFKELLQEGYQKFKHGTFQVWGIDGYIVIVSPDHLTELNALGTDALDFHAASQKRIIGEYEWLRIADELEAHTILTDLTRHIGTLLPSMHEEVDHAIATEWPTCKEWTPVVVWPRMFRTMALLISLMIVGPELSRNEYWLSTMIKFVEEVFIGGWELKSYSLFMRSIAARGLVPGIRRVWKHQDNARKLLVPIIEKRRAEETQARIAGVEFKKPTDMLYWLAQGAKKMNPVRTGGNVAELCLMMNFAALHAATVTLTNIVFDLAANPQYVAPLREEYRAAQEKYGGLAEKQALLVNSLSKLDSLMKESQRLNPGTLTTFSRLVKKPITLSSGVHLPKGTHILVPAAIISLDPDIYNMPLEFRPFRFHENRSAASGEDVWKDQFTTTSPRQMHFGYGRQSCPGRFFASAAIKTILVHFLEEFDISLADGEGRPKNSLRGAMNIPSETAEVMLKRREKP